MSVPDPHATLLARIWRRIPVVVRATVVALVILAIGQAPPGLALWVNLSRWPDVPLFLVVTAVWLWLYWRWLDGGGWPRGTSAQRHAHLRATPLNGSVWRWSLLAGGAGMAAVLGLALLTGRIAALPAEAYEAPLDVSAWPPFTTFAFFLSLAATAGVVEEAAFRGYMLTQIERRHGWIVAIVLSGALFYVVHLSHAYATPAFVPFFAAYSALHGLLVYLTRSIRPSVVVHVAGDFCILPIQYGAVPLPFGTTALPYLVLVLVAAAIAVPAFFGLAARTRVLRE